MMARIAKNVETSDNFPTTNASISGRGDQPNAEMITTAISRSTVAVAIASRATAILCSSESGAQRASLRDNRPSVPLLGITPFESTARRMQLLWGVTPLVVSAFHNTDEMILKMVRAAKARGHVQIDDNVVLTAGIPLEVHGVTNMVKVHTIREVDLLLAPGHKGHRGESPRCPS